MGVRLSNGHVTPPSERTLWGAVVVVALSNVMTSGASLTSLHNVTAGGGGHWEDYTLGSQSDQSYYLLLLSPVGKLPISLTRRRNKADPCSEGATEQLRQVK